MLDSRENSVLKSLKELRKQEEERVKKERAEAEARSEAERRAKEDAERRAKEEVLRAKREEEERLRKIEEDKLAREREERLRLEEAERRARIEAETQLQRERMQIEANARTAAKAKGLHPRIIVAIVAGVLIIAGGVIFKIKADHEKRLAVEQEATARAAKEAEVAHLRLAEEEKRIQLLLADLSKAKSDAERIAIQKQIDDARARSHSSPSGSSATKSSPKEKVEKEAAPKEKTAATQKPLIKEKKGVSDDPLEGLKL
jgi:hypothetical protein